jgi:hypothetical protein
MHLTLPLPMIGLLIVFIGIFAAEKLAKMNSIVIDILAWILGIVLFTWILLAYLAPIMHWF